MSSPTTICNHEVKLAVHVSVFPQETVFSSGTKNRAFYFTSSVSTNRLDGWLPINEWLKHNQKCLTSTWNAYDHEWSLPTLCAWPCVCPLLWYAKQDRLRGSLVCGRLRNSQLWHISFRSLWSNKLNWSSKYKRSEQKSISCLNILLCVYFYNLSFFTYLGHFTWVTLNSVCQFISSPDSDAKKPMTDICIPTFTLEIIVSKYSQVKIP